MKTTRIKLIALALALLAPHLFAADAPMKDYGRAEYVRVSKDLPHLESTPWRLVCTMPYNCHFQPSIEVEAEAGKVIAFNQLSSSTTTPPARGISAGNSAL